MRTETKNSNQFSILCVKELITQIEMALEHRANDTTLLYLHKEAKQLITAWQLVIKEIVETNSNTDSVFTAISETNKWSTIKASYEILNNHFLTLNIE